MAAATSSKAPPIDGALVYEAAEAVIRFGCGSGDQIRSKLRVDRATADALLVELERIGVVGPHRGGGAVRSAIIAGSIDKALARAKEVCRFIR